jgi:lysozyme family protein
MINVTLDKSFDKCFDRVIGHEGGFQNMHDDRGNWTRGEVGKGTLKGTKFGISAMSYPKLDIENLTLSLAKAIYLSGWWIPLQMDNFKPAMQYQMFDAAINHGRVSATKMLQRAIGVTEDGVIGPLTLKAKNEIEPNDMIMLFIAERIAFFAQIKTFDLYGKGWMNRMALNLKLATQDN